jgi:hypothetical protein
MDLKDLAPMVLLIIVCGMLLGVGVITFQSFRSSALTTTTVSAENITIASGVGQTAFNNVTGFTLFGNVTVNTTINASLRSAVTVSAEGVVTASATYWKDSGAGISDYLLYYTYNGETPTTSVMSNMVKGVADIPSVWFGLIITIVILSIILGLVINSFGQRNR